MGGRVGRRVQSLPDFLRVQRLVPGHLALASPRVSSGTLLAPFHPPHIIEYVTPEDRDADSGMGYKGQKAFDQRSGLS